MATKTTETKTKTDAKKDTEIKTKKETAKELKEKKKKKTTTIMLIIVCIMIILYTAADFILQYFTSVEVSPTLTQAWFAFWGGELLCLTGIKISKVFKGNNE